MRTRLVFTANDRPAYFRDVAATWAAVPAVEAWHPRIFCEPTRALAEMAAIAATIPGARFTVNPARFGVLHNPWQALAVAFTDGADFVVIAEDDVVVAEDILTYFAWAAHRFASEHVLAVCATSYAEACPRGEEHRVVFRDRFTPMVWGTWADRWAGVLRDTWDHAYSSGTPEGPESGWDWNLNLRVIPAGGWRVVAPLASRTDHIGRLGGAHTNQFTFPGSVSVTFRTHYPAGRFHIDP